MKFIHKLPVVLISVAALTALGIGVVSHRNLQHNIIESETERLEESVSFHAKQVQHYVRQLTRDIVFLSNMKTVHNALTEMGDEWRKMGSGASKKLRTTYIDDNPHPEGQRELFYKGYDGSKYSELHARYHPLFERLRRYRNFYDIFLFDTKGNLVYSVLKENDFGTNFNTGPWANSGLGKLYRKILSERKESILAFEDFSSYGPSGGEASAFVGSPIMDNRGKFLGVVAYQISTDDLDNILHNDGSRAANRKLNYKISHDGEGPKDNLVQSSRDIFLIGDDGRNRSNMLAYPHIKPMEVEVGSDMASKAAQGKQGITYSKDIKGNAVYAAYHPVDFLGVRWALIEHISVKEMFLPVKEFSDKVMIQGLVFLLIIMMVGVVMARLIVTPLARLANAMKDFVRDDQVRAGDDIVSRTDEFGMIGHAFNDMAVTVSKFQRELKKAVQKKTLDLTQSHNRLQAIMNSVGESILTLDQKGKIISVNAAAIQLFAAEKEALEGMNIKDFFPDSDAANQNNYVLRYLERGRDKMFDQAKTREQTVQRSDGTEFLVECFMSRLEVEGAPIYTCVIRDVSESRKLENIATRLGRILDNSSNEILILDADNLKFNQVNSRALRNLGYAQEEMEERTLCDICADITQDELQEYLDSFTGDEKKSISFEATLIRKDGSEYIAEMNLQYSPRTNPPVYVILAQDISERKKSEARATQLSRLFESSLMEIYIFDSETFRFQQVSPGAQENLGYTMDELHELTAWDIKPNIGKEEFLKMVRPLQAGEEKLLCFETIHRRKDGSDYDVEVNLQLTEESGTPVYVAVIADITERKCQEREIIGLNEGLESRIRERTKQLEKANDDLSHTLESLQDAQAQLIEQEKMASLGGLVAGVAHEINTPVGIGVTAASHLSEAGARLKEAYQENLMKRGDLEQFIDTTAQSTEIILSNLRRAADLIRSFKQVAVDQSSEEKRIFQMKTYMDEVLLSLRPKLKKHDHSIIVKCDPDLRVEGYPGVLSQVITNLVMNSVIHAYDEGDEGNMRIEVTEDGDDIKLVYSDDGKGVTEDVRAKLFDPFFTTQRGSGGSGLGMNIVYNLVTRKLGGRITCDSTPGEGIRFTLTWPAEAGKRPEEQDQFTAA